jgi:DNA-binding NtrC family response regulator
MSVSPTNVHALRPMRILLVSDDTKFADRVVSAAARQGLHIARAASEDDLDVATIRHAPNVIVLDARDALRRAVRAATVFAALHPSIAVVLVADGATTPDVSGVRLVDKSSSAERLLGEVERAFLGLGTS